MNELSAHPRSRVAVSQVHNRDRAPLSLSRVYIVYNGLYNVVPVAAAAKMNGAIWVAKALALSRTRIITGSGPAYSRVYRV